MLGRSLRAVLGLLFGESRQSVDSKTVLVCGSRYWRDEQAIRRELEWLAPSRVIVGDARGADLITVGVAGSMGVDVVVFFADWDTYGRQAGPMRNAAMVRAKPDLCLAFFIPGSRGTLDTINRCVAAGIPIRVVEGNDNG